MIGLGRRVPVFARAEPTDMRKKRDPRGDAPIGEARTTAASGEAASRGGAPRRPSLT